MLLILFASYDSTEGSLEIRDPHYEIRYMIFEIQYTIKPIKSWIWNHVYVS